MTYTIHFATNLNGRSYSQTLLDNAFDEYMRKSNRIGFWMGEPNLTNAAFVVDAITYTTPFVSATITTLNTPMGVFLKESLSNHRSGISFSMSGLGSLTKDLTVQEDYEFLYLYAFPAITQ